MTPRRQRMLLIGLVVAGVTLSAGLALRAFQENLRYFFSPSQVVAGEAPDERLFRLGGMVVEGSVARPGDGLTVKFDLTDNEEQVTVRFAGILPDLFREGQGIIANGKLDTSGDFIAEEVLAKHDENYMPPELAGMKSKEGYQ